jgi:GT2 family glycosyltransferase
MDNIDQPSTALGEPSPTAQGMHCNGGIGVVMIGRNEGERLRRCLESVSRTTIAAVYVDSGSSDGSVELARTFGVDVVELDLSIPFCAARARNEGFKKLLGSNAHLEFIQFIDGDCELIGDWLKVASAELERNPQLAIVAGYLHEKHPEHSIYNRLGNLEWNFSKPGEVESVGGIFMARKEAFEGVGGFDNSVSAGEEPELCSRLRKNGWKIFRLDHGMAWHDLAMHRFGQWWKRMIRYGYGSSDVATRFNLNNFRRNNIRTRAWSLWLLVVIAMFAFTMNSNTGNINAQTLWISVLFLCFWPAQLSRIAIRTWTNGVQPSLAIAYGFFIMLSYWPQMIGQLLYWMDRFKKRSFRLVEYKTNR